MLLWSHSGGELWKKFLVRQFFMVHLPEKTKRKKKPQDDAEKVE